MLLLIGAFGEDLQVQRDDNPTYWADAFALCKTRQGYGADLSLNLARSQAIGRRYADGLSNSILHRGSPS